jgi:hypothetical protein
MLLRNKNKLDLCLVFHNNINNEVNELDLGSVFHNNTNDEVPKNPNSLGAKLMC